MGTCYLCEREAPLRVSHVLPAFATRHLVETCPTYVRSNKLINRRAQDGKKLELLCDECEGLLSGWEKEFAESVFVPIHEGPGGDTIEYGPWACKFAASVSLRILGLYAREGGLDEKWAEVVESTVRSLRAYLLGRDRHPGSHEQHLFVLSPTVGPGTSPYLNRYLARTIGIDFLSHKKACWTWGKMCRVVVLGCLHDPQATAMGQTRVRVRKGTIRSKGTPVPHRFFGYMNLRADEVGKGMRELSERQRGKIAKAYDEGAGLLEGTALGEAMGLDFINTGTRAIDITEPKP